MDSTRVDHCSFRKRVEDHWRSVWQVPKFMLPSSYTSTAELENTGIPDRNDGFPTLVYNNERWCQGNCMKQHFPKNHACNNLH